MMTSAQTKALWRAIRKSSDRTLLRFFEEVQKKRLLTIRCPSCKKNVFPPRPFCPDCLNQEVEVTEHGGRGRVYAFTTMGEPSEGGKPMTVAMVELQGVEGRVFAAVDCPFEEMTIGMEVIVVYSQWEGMVVPWFRPLEPDERG